MFKKGYKQTQVHKDKIGKANAVSLKGHKGHWLGKKRSHETIEKVRMGNLGKKHSEETKRKMSVVGKGRKLTEEAKLKISKAHKGKPKPNQSGEKSGKWKGGITPINHKIRTSLEYKLWRTAVFERDNYMCIWGGKEHGSKLNADHIKPFAYYPELRFAIDNGRTLCVTCHRATDTFGNKCRKNYE